MDDAVRVRERDRLADAQEDAEPLGDVPRRAAIQRSSRSPRTRFIA